MQEATRVSVPRYDTVAVFLHWVVAMAILIQLALGWWMIELPKSPPGLRAGWFNVDKSIGVTIGDAPVRSVGGTTRRRSADAAATRQAERVG